MHVNVGLHVQADCLCGLCCLVFFSVVSLAFVLNE